MGCGNTPAISGSLFELHTGMLSFIGIKYIVKHLFREYNTHQLVYPLQYLQYSRAPKNVSLKNGQAGFFKNIPGWKVEDKNKFGKT